MTVPESEYELVYWPTLQGRGEFARLLFEDAGVGYRDRARELETPEEWMSLIRAYREGSVDGFPPYAPPILRVGALVLSQTAVICEYVGHRVGLAPRDEPGRLAARQLMACVMDVVSEAHDTHHPISAAMLYEEQTGEALVAAQAFIEHRLSGWLAYFERVLERSPGDRLLGAETTYVDIAMFQLIEGLEYAFPRAMASLSPIWARLRKLRDDVAGRPRLAAYLASERRIPFNELGIFRRYPELDRVPR